MGSEKQQTSTFESELYQPCFEADWYNHILYDLAEWANGLAFRSIHFSPQGKPVIKIAEMKNGISSQTKFTEGHFDQIYHVAYGDMLFSWSGQPETSIDVFIWRGPDGWLNQHIFKVHPKRQCDKQFFFYLLRYLKPNFVRIARNKQTTGLGHVTKKDLRNISVKLPPLPEQRAIAHILGSLDNKIELCRQMNQTLEATARAVFKSWFVDFDPVRAKAEGRPTGLPDDIAALFPDSFENSEIGEIPKGWEVGALECLATLKTQTVQPSTKPKKIWEHYSIPAFDEGKQPILEAGESIKSGKYLVPPNSVLASKLNPQFPRVWLPDVQDSNSSICSTEFMPFVPIVESWRPYLYEMLKSQTIQFEIIRRVTGSTGSRQRVKPREIAVLPCLVPPRKLIDFFCSQVGPWHDNLHSNIRQSATLAHLRDTLLPKLISGELRLPDAEKFVEEAVV